MLIRSMVAAACIALSDAMMTHHPVRMTRWLDDVSQFSGSSVSTTDRPSSAGRATSTPIAGGMVANMMAATTAGRMAPSGGELSTGRSGGMTAMGGSPVNGGTSASGGAGAAGGVVGSGGMASSGGMQDPNTGGSPAPMNCRDFALVQSCDMDAEYLACDNRVGTCSDGNDACTRNFDCAAGFCYTDERCNTIHANCVESRGYPAMANCLRLFVTCLREENSNEIECGQRSSECLMALPPCP